ncbi:MAG: Ku protein [Limnochordia bacterium]|jgi:DNA end-binding protein Ku
MRSMWKGSISFGLVNIPVRMYTATQRQDLKFKYLHQPCSTPIKYQKFCPQCGREVPSEQLVRAYEFTPGEYVPMTEEDFEELPGPETKAINILDFTQLAEIDPVYYDKTYYLEPLEGSRKPYYLLLKAMERAEKVAIAKVVIRSKEVLAALRVYDQALALETMFFAQEVRDVSQLTGLGHVELDQRELQMALEIIENLSTTFQPEKYQNEYQQALLEVIENKIQGRETTIPQESPKEEVLDLMAALEASLRATKEPALRR